MPFFTYINKNIKEFEHWEKEFGIWNLRNLIRNHKILETISKSLNFLFYLVLIESTRIYIANFSNHSIIYVFTDL